MIEIAIKRKMSVRPALTGFGFRWQLITNPSLIYRVLAFVHEIYAIDKQNDVYGDNCAIKLKDWMPWCKLETWELLSICQSGKTHILRTPPSSGFFSNREGNLKSAKKLTTRQ